MSNLVIQPVETRRQRKQFLELPWEINRSDQNWMPPLRQNQQELVGYKHHPFYKDAEGQTFLAFQDGQPVGRVMAILNHAHNRFHKENRGFFGFFESIDDQAVASGLFGAVRGWLAPRRVPQIRGPQKPSMDYECGLLIEGLATAPFFMMTHNLPYYQRLIEGCGFGKIEDMFAFYGRIEKLQTLDKKLAFMVEECSKRFDVKLRRMDRSRFNQEVKMFLDIYNQALVGTWGFVPMSEAEVDHMAASLKHLIAPEMTTVAEI